MGVFNIQATSYEIPKPLSFGDNQSGFNNSFYEGIWIVKERGLMPIYISHLSWNGKKTF